jgi:sec-independent protein translocase protein TatA
MTTINNLNIMLSLFQGEHMIFILLAVLLLFGGRKIPELMRGIGKGMREFKDAKDNVKSEIEVGMREKENTRVNTTAEEIRLQELKLKQLREQQEVISNQAS